MGTHWGCGAAMQKGNEAFQKWVQTNRDDIEIGNDQQKIQDAAKKFSKLVQEALPIKQNNGKCLRLSFPELFKQTSPYALFHTLTSKQIKDLFGKGIPIPRTE